jgi:hypothetical protein
MVLIHEIARLAYTGQYQRRKVDEGPITALDSGADE